MNEPDVINTQEVIGMLDVIYKGVEPGCKDRCYIKGSGADSVKWVLEEACEYLRTYACLEIGLTEDNSIKGVLDMMKEKWRRMYGKCCYIDTDSAKEGTDEANKP